MWKYYESVDRSSLVHDGPECYSLLFYAKRLRAVKRIHLQLIDERKWECDNHNSNRILLGDPTREIEADFMQTELSRHLQ